MTIIEINSLTSLEVIKKENVVSKFLGQCFELMFKAEDKRK